MKSTTEPHPQTANRGPQRRRGFVRHPWLAGALLAAFTLAARPASAVASARQHADAPTFAIILPLYYNNSVSQGPVGTMLTIQAASGWTPGAGVVLGVVPAGQSCASANQIPVSAVSQITVDGKGSFSAIFQWPAAAAQLTAYSICANETGVGTQIGASSNNFSVLATTPPSISLTAASSPHAGDTLTVTGADWLPPAQTIKFLLRSTQPGLPDVPLATADGSATMSDTNGNFTANVKLPNEYTGKWYLLATMGTPTQFGSAIYYPLSGTSPLLTIGQPQVETPTPLPTFTPTAIPATATPTGQGQSSGTTQNQKLLIILLALVAVVLLGAGVVVAILALRGRGNTPEPIDWGRSSVGGPGRGGPTAADWDETQGGGWNNEWQSPTGQPWSGRESGRIGGAPPPAMLDEDDPYQTQAGQPPQPYARPSNSRGSISKPLPPPRPGQPPNRPPWNAPGVDDAPTNPQRPPGPPR